MNKIWAKTLIDIEVIINFILSSFIKKANILLQIKSDVYIITDIDKKLFKYNKKMINYKIKEIRLYIRSYINDM